MNLDISMFFVQIVIGRRILGTRFHLCACVIFERIQLKYSWDEFLGVRNESYEEDSILVLTGPM